MIVTRFTGLVEATARMHGRELRARNLRLAWEMIDKGSVTPMFRRQFASRGAFGGQPWQRLRPTTQRARLRAGGNRGGVDHPLWDSGRLKASLENVGPESIKVVTAKKYQRGTRVPYAALHQRGFRVSQWGRVKFRVPRTVPARQVIPDPAPKYLVRAWARTVARFIAGRL